MSANPGWYPDPGGGEGLFRYWDGKAWSAATSPNPSAPPPSQSLIGGPPQQSGQPYGQGGQPQGQGGQPTYGQSPYGQDYGSSAYANYQELEKKKSPIGWWIAGAALVIGIITLAGAAIGLMNIMLVAVTERTKEIGLSKAVGGKQRNIRRQFLFEAMIISLMGAFFGVILGVLIGNIAALLMGTSFVIPWNWMFIGIVICSIVGLLAGLYPALKASRLNPIEALRYE